MSLLSRSRKWFIVAALLLAIQVVSGQAPKPVTGVFVAGPVPTGSVTNLCATTTCWFVRPNGGAYGTEVGTSWTNAYDGFSDITWSAVGCGHIIWVAGGTYTQALNPLKNCTAGTRLTIRRATTNDTSIQAVSGWSSSFASQIVQGNSGSMSMETGANYITISGWTGPGDTCGTVPGATCGWQLSRSATTSGSGIEWPNGSNSSNIIVEYLDVVGPGEVTYSADGRGVDATSFSSATNNTISHCRVHHWESTFYIAQTNFVVEFSEIHNVNAINWPEFHPNGAYVTSSNNFTWRYNLMHDKIGEGVFWTNNDTSVSGANVYGNICYNVSASTDKCFQPDNTGTFSNMKFYNNLCENNAAQCFANAGPSWSSSEARNNIFSRASGVDLSGLTQSNNLTTTNSAVFVNRASGDFHITATIGAGFPRNAGTSLAATLTTDRDGVAYGGDGTWDIGPYEYVAAPPPPAPEEALFGLLVRLVR